MGVIGCSTCSFLGFSFPSCTCTGRRLTCWSSLPPLISLPLCSSSMDSVSRPWRHSRAPQPSSSPLSSSCFSSSSPQTEDTPEERRYKDTRSERPVCPEVPQWPPMALHEGLCTHIQTHTRIHTNTHTSTHTGKEM